MRSSPFDVFHDVGDALLWVRAYKHVDLVNVALQCQDFDIVFRATNHCEFFETLLNTGYLKNPPSIPRAKNKVVFDLRNRSCSPFVFVCH